MHQLALVLSLALAASAAAAVPAKIDVPENRAFTLAAGTAAPDFTARDAAGKLHRLSEFRGKIVVLDFWATWCGVCKEELPHLAKLARAAGPGVVVLAVCVWDKDRNFDKWTKKDPTGGGILFLCDTVGDAKDRGIFTTQYKASHGLPTTYVIDRDGRIVTGVWGWLASDPWIEEGLHALGVQASGK